MKKVIIFYSLLTIVVILATAEMNWVTAPALVIAIVALGSFTCSMTGAEVAKVSGEEFFNKVLKTNDFSKE